MDLVQLFEANPDQFTEIPKTDFDNACRNKEFSEGPIVTEKSRELKEFGPYDPYRWAFGQKKDGVLIKALV